MAKKISVKVFKFNFVSNCNVTSMGLATLICQYRFYDAGQGRWLNRDPIGYEGGMNLYSYCDSAPVGAADFEGWDKLVFSGKYLKWYYDHGKETHRWRAYAGKPGTGRNDVSSAGGPIPPGKWQVDPANIGRGRATDLRGNDFPMSDGWGRGRVRIDPKPGTKTYGRDEMYSRGGKYIGSLGCVDVGNNESDVIEMLAKYGHVIDMDIDYSGWNGTVPGAGCHPYGLEWP